MGCVFKRPVVWRIDWKQGNFRTEAVRIEIRASDGGKEEKLALKIILQGRNRRLGTLGGRQSQVCGLGCRKYPPAFCKPFLGTVVKLFSHQIMSDSRNPMDWSPQGSSVHGILQARILGVGSHFFLQGIFPTQGWSACLLHWQADSLLLSHMGSPLWSRQSLIHCVFVSLFTFEFSLILQECYLSFFLVGGRLCWCADFISCSPQAQLLWDMWDLSSPTRDRACVPTLEGGFLITGLPGKSCKNIIFSYFFLAIATSNQNVIHLPTQSLSSTQSRRNAKHFPGLGQPWACSLSVDKAIMSRKRPLLAATEYTVEVSPHTQ